MTDDTDDTTAALADGAPFDLTPPAGWRAAPDCAKCGDTGRATTGGCCGPTVEAFCDCKRGRLGSELWLAEKYGTHHPDTPDRDPSDFYE